MVIVKTLFVCPKSKISYNFSMSLRVHKKKNKSGSISIQVVDRSGRGYNVVETVGCSSDENTVEQFYKTTLQRIDKLEHNLFSNTINESNTLGYIDILYIYLVNVFYLICSVLSQLLQEVICSLCIFYLETCIVNINGCFISF